MAHPTDPRAAQDARRGTATSADEAAPPRENPRATNLRHLRSRHPEMDWNDPESALETLANLHDTNATAELEEAENDIATGNLLPLDRYAPPH